MKKPGTQNRRQDDRTRQIWPGFPTNGGQNKDLLALAVEATNDGIWVWHVPTGEAYFNNRYYTMLGYEPGEFPASFDAWASLLHPEDAQRTRQAIQEQLDAKSDGYQIEFRLRQKSGQWLWILGRGKVVQRDEDGHAILMAGSHVDIDIRKRTERKLDEYKTMLERKVKERTKALEQTTSVLETTFDAIPDVLGIQDSDHHIIRYNAAGYKLLNRTPEEVVGRRCFELIGRDKECERCATTECYITKKPASTERYEEALEVWLDVRAYPILDEEGNLVKVIEHLRDISATKKAEVENLRLNNQLQQAQKMESLGTLAGGVAHDFNNLLMAIQGRISLMSMEMDSGHRHEEHITAINTYIESATNLTKQLLGFARGGKYEVEPFDVNTLISQSVKMFGRTHKEIEIRTNTKTEDLTVEADRRQIEQVLLNVFINAWQAMPEGGRLDISTSVVDLGRKESEFHKVRSGPFVKIAITDTGCGIDPAIQKKIFDPFFTTKEKKRGTGLGLASAYGIVKNHAGFITVQSTVGCGSTFSLFLPSSGKAVLKNPSSLAGIVRGKETILLVDDEAMILEVGKAMLEKLGYRVLLSKEGKEAVETIKQKTMTVDLVILDMIMPGLDGGKTFDQIQKARPALPVLLSSGYAMNHQAKAILQKGCSGFIQKPFDLATLSEKIRSVLE